MSQSEIEACMNDPELALKKLELLLESVNNVDESVANPAIESLENCGAPRGEHFELLLKYLNDSDSLRVFWAATLVGRLFDDGFQAAAGRTQSLQELVTERLADPNLAESSKEKICWAISSFPSVDTSLRAVLVKLSANASPRMLRLIESALSKA
ncbi:MAG: hypothetical protein ACK5YR_09835 [Pirellula sp.]|jgi:hypothetical protein